MAAGWLVTVGTGLYAETIRALRQMNDKARVDVAHRQSLRVFLASGNAAALTPPAPIPYYRADELIRLLSDEAFRALLPHTLIPRTPGPLSVACGTIECWNYLCAKQLFCVRQYKWQIKTPTSYIGGQAKR